MSATVTYSLRVLTELHVGSGVPSATADDTVVRAPSGVPEVPQSKLKGAVRVALREEAEVDEGLLAEALGTEDGPGGAVVFSPAVPSEGLEPIVDEVTTVALSSLRTPRTGQRARLEVVRPYARNRDGALEPLWLCGSLRGEPATAASTDSVAAVAVCGLAMVHALGRRKTRGWGQVRVAVDADDRLDQRLHATLQRLIGDGGDP